MKRPPSHQPKLRRIVIVEDNLDQVHSLALLLKEMGHTVDYAINGYVALDVVRRFRPDTVICDLGIPGVTGYEVAEQIKKDPELSGIRVVALTAYTEDKYRQRAMEVGFDAFYTKPMDVKQLYELFGDAKDAFTRG
ncbi:MAG TPA: response regulator [Burkholderiales bacterium]|nr:response regulator [Burkholderiales bacterium]